MDRQRFLRARVALLVAVARAVVTVACVVFAAVSSTEAAVDCLVAAISSCFLFAYSSDCADKAALRAAFCVSWAASSFF